MKAFLKYFGIFILLAAAGTYFYFAATLSNKGKKDETCSSIKVIILDSAQNRFVNQEDVIKIMTSYMGPLEGTPNEKIKLNVIEDLLGKRIMVRKAEACLNLKGEMLIKILQRRPIIRIESENGGFYIDDTKYIFPLAENYTSYVPVVSGNIPIALYQDYRGTAVPELEDWVNGVYELGMFLYKNSFWNAQIEQIYIDKKGDLYLCPRVGNQRIVLGDFANIDNKFSKLEAFYSNVIPSVGWEMYDKINLKYKDQIVCTKRKKNKQ